jgi:hypothetical protein
MRHARILGYMIAAPLLLAILAIAVTAEIKLLLDQPGLALHDILLALLASWVVAQWFGLMMLYRAAMSERDETAYASTSASSALS